jgi:hypothetical protein
MLALPLTLAKARRLWHEDFVAHCAAMPLQCRTRTHPATRDADGNVVRPARTEHYYVQPKAAPSTAKDLMAYLVFLSLRALEQRNRAFKAQPGREAGAVQLEAPAISVNCVQLGTYCSLSSRTVRTLLDALRRLGAITRKAWHGTRANFELWIHPKYLWTTPTPGGDNDLGCWSLSSLLQSEATKLPLKALETLATKKLETTRGDKLVTSLVPAVQPRTGRHVAAAGGLATRATLSGNTGLQLPATGLADEKARGGRRGVAVPGEPAPTNRTQQLGWVDAFWDHARERLYAGVRFDAAQHARAREAIWHGVYAGFGTAHVAVDGQVYHQQALERVDLVAGWLARHPGAYLPAPYAEIVPGRGYFDRENPQGFGRTEEWHARRQRLVRAHHIARTLRQAAAHFRGWHAGKAPRWVLSLEKRQLYQHYLQQVKAWHDPQALTQFLRLSSGLA